MITATVPRSELEQIASHRANLLKTADDIKNLTIQQRATLLNESAVGSVIDNLEDRFLLTDITECNGESYGLFVHPELNLVGIYSYKQEKLLVIGEVALIRPHWLPLIYNND